MNDDAGAMVTDRGGGEARGVRAVPRTRASHPYLSPVPLTRTVGAREAMPKVDPTQVDNPANTWRVLTPHEELRCLEQYQAVVLG